MKIDTSKIEGYEGMSAEDKLKALEEFDMDMSGYVSKELFDKASSQIADFKKKEKAGMDESAKALAELKESLESANSELNKLKSEKQISEFKAQFLGLGYDEKSAQEAAVAQSNGDWNKVFKLHKTVIEKTVADTKAELLKGTPQPPGGEGGAPETHTVPTMF